tara:strand:+ start:587 stop:697 length:111 start_codon:yes stop_codon:yes gene_type:complete
MTQENIKYKKLMVETMVELFKSIPATAITTVNIKKK